MVDNCTVFGLCSNNIQPVNIYDKNPVPYTARHEMWGICLAFRSS